MKKSLPLSLLMALMLMSLDLWAQSTLKGVVTDASKGEGLPGVSIVVKGTTNGTTSGGDGSYSINLPNADATLIFSYIGYETMELPAKGRTTLNVQLKADQKALEEVVVIGYGSVKRSDVTGAVATVKTEDLLKTIPTSINQGLQGQVAGVQVNRSDGAPGAGISLTIRGANSFTGSEPLYVIDGIPFTSPSATGSSTGGANPSGGTGQSTNALSYINPQDIESMEILKDASATAIYGSRGANGVVLITTKKGKSDKDRIEVVANTSISEISRQVKVLNAYQYAQFQNEAQLNAERYNGYTPATLPFPGTRGFDPTIGDSTYLPAPEDFLNGTAGDSYPAGFKGTDWQKQIFRRAITKDYTLRMSGGSDKGTYSVSGNMLDQQGIIVNSGFKRYGLQANIVRKVHKWIELGTSNNITFTDYKLGKTNSNGNEASIISSALFFPPTYPISSPESKAREDATSWYAAANPYNYTRTAKDQTHSTGIYSSTYALLKFTDYLSFRQNLGVNYNVNNREVYYNRRLQEARTTNGYAYSSDDTWRGITLESILNFNRTFHQDHSVNAVVGVTRETGYSYYRNMSVRGFPDDLLQNNNIGAGLNQKTLGSGKSENGLFSMLGRLNYSYKGKYLATASFRRDGSSRFTTKNKYANFASFALAWNAGDETFVQDLNLFSTLKFRAGYGQTGNQGIGSYRSLPMFAFSAYPINGALQPGYADVTWRGPADVNLRWETTDQFNAGVDMGFMQNRFTVTVDVYKKKTHDLLQPIQIPNSTGFTTQLTNFGTVENKGLEISGIGQLVTTPRFNWGINANISFNRNRMLDLPGDQFAGSLYNNFDNFFLQRNGQPIGTVYGFVEDGFYDNLAEVVADPNYAGQSEAVQRMMIGEIKYKNFDEDPAITAKDRQIIGNTNPDYNFGITNNFSYRNLNLSVFVQGVQGNDIVNTNLYQIRMGKVANLPQFVYDGRWTPENAANATWPKALAADTRQPRLSNRLVQDGSYVRLKNINVGYSFKKPASFIDVINVYASVSNVLTFTDYKWFDPDVNAFGSDASRRGVDMNSYPNSRTYTLGVSAGF
ncbi:SusC/RagA family TonB-linked outer membrane protein [Hymenobacter crusticola]|uniref:SusC/RagA family protein n=1 Tax=Hymenobacter crusticola TaxID=1770526 RepID=A0A243W7H9_9BACT|nr:TonB-dependent receptor [Hymenobacter crusticola]OUJ70406.1 SusC/RagA family protein [Hymenobacter crusticola]